MNIQPLNSTTDTKRFIGCGHTTLYKLLGTGALQARKLGGKTLITGESIIALINSLPAASIGGNGGCKGDAA